MKDLICVQNMDDLHKLFNVSGSSHPLMSVIDFSKVHGEVQHGTKITSDLYAVIFKHYCKNNLKYGRKSVDFREGHLICIAPNQIVEIDNENEEKDEKMGYGLFFHPDLIRSTSLSDKIKKYTFFYYEVSEALHLSENEKTIITDCILKIQTEMQQNNDVHSHHIIIYAIELLLNYCLRFYGRQLMTRSITNRPIVAKVENILTNYFGENLAREEGLPSVKYLANKANLSPSYLSDLLRKETGKNAQEQIHFFIIEEAKNFLLNFEKNVSEIAFDLGFEYPQYLNKL